MIQPEESTPLCPGREIPRGVDPSGFGVGAAVTRTLAQAGGSGQDPSSRDEPKILRHPDSGHGMAGCGRIIRQEICQMLRRAGAATLLANAIV